MDLLTALSNKPECYKAVTHQLITSCQSIREVTLSPRPSLEDLETTKSIFAARLAICELQEADANTPSQCKPLLSGSPAASGRASSNPLQLSAGQLRACLRALEAKPQSWTSYSNSRQNAALICDVSRAEIMKEEALDLFHVLIEHSFNFVQASADARQHANSHREADLAFAETLKDLHAEEIRNLARARQQTEAVIEESRNQFAQAVSHMSDTIRSAVAITADLEQMVEVIFRSAATGDAELASARLRDAEANHEVILALRQMVHDVASNDFAILQDGLRTAIGTAVSADSILWVKPLLIFEKNATRSIIKTVQVDSASERSAHRSREPRLRLTTTGGARYFGSREPNCKKDAVTSRFGFGGCAARGNQQRLGRRDATNHQRRERKLRLIKGIFRMADIGL
jgi:Tht1-like nuclear fusion protein